MSLGLEPACAAPATWAAAARTVSMVSPDPQYSQPFACALRRPSALTLPGPAACPAGWFGPGCQMRCSCANDGLCHPVTGRCSCAPGWTGLSCQRGRWHTVCGLGAWPGHGAHASAGPGKADAGCVAACDGGRWGPDCSHPCTCSPGHGSCDAVSGLCVCEAGYTGPRCEQRESWPTHSHAPTHGHAYTRTHAHTCRGPGPALLFTGWAGGSSPELPQLPCPARPSSQPLPSPPAYLSLSGAPGAAGRESREQVPGGGQG